MFFPRYESEQADIPEDLRLHRANLLRTKILAKKRAAEEDFIKVDEAKEITEGKEDKWSP